MLTRCPACGTTFRLRPEQLSRAQGRVRCGHCKQAFSAADNLLEAAPDRDSTTSSEVQSATKFSMFPPEFAPAPSARKRFVARPAQAAPGSTSPPETVSDVPASSASEAPAPTPASGPVLASPAQVPAGDSSPAPATEGSPLLAETEAESVDDASPEDQPSYLDAPAPGRRWPWGVGIALLGTALAMQALFLARTDIAKHHPGLRPALEAACRQLGCEVELPHDVEFVSIEASDLHPEAGNTNHLLLLATIKNRAAYPQSYPHLELTLTDVRDQPVARRVFAPTDYLPKGSEAIFAPGADLAIRLELAQESITASGYRVYVFYP